MTATDLSPELPPSARSGPGLVNWNGNVYLWGGSVDDTSLYMMNFTENSWKVIETIGSPPSPRQLYPYFLFEECFYVFPGASYVPTQIGNGCFRISLISLIWELLNCDLARIVYAYGVVEDYILLLGGTMENGRTNELLIGEISENIVFSTVTSHWNYPLPRLGHSLHKSRELLWLFGGYSQGL